ncbi:MAG TPA: hypothetical protein VM468_01110 [Mycoplana sp.]|nr:hypothetical protein [Mycoplana sp.]
MAEERPRLAALDDLLDELEASRATLARELAGADLPAEDFWANVARVKAQFNPANVEISIRKLIFLASNNA